MAYRGIPPFYYPSVDSREADAAYAAWCAHYAQHQWPSYPSPAYSASQYPTNPVSYPVAYPTMPAPPQPAYGWQFEQPQVPKLKKYKTADVDDDDDSDEWGAYSWAPGTYMDPNGWMIDPDKRNKDKKKKKKDGKKDVEYIMHYVPSGQSPDERDEIKADGKYHYNWYGRSAPQVQEDRHQQAVDAGVYKPRKKVPDAEGGDKFWVVDPKTHASNLHSFSDIQTNFKGSWQIDDRFGSSYFLKRGDKAPAGWDSD